jgi:putative intracellular protease/amidase
MAERLIGMLIFPRLTQLDMTGPYEVLARLPNTKVHLVAHSMAPVKTDRGMEIVPTTTFADCPQLDLVMVPGGPGQQDLMEDAVALDFLRKQARGVKYLTRSAPVRWCWVPRACSRASARPATGPQSSISSRLARSR